MDRKITENINQPNLASSSNLTAAGQPVFGSDDCSMGNFYPKLQQFEDILLSVPGSHQLAANKDNIEGTIKKLKEHQRQMELHETLNEILQKNEKISAEIVESKKRKVSMGIFEEDKAIDKKIRMDLSISTFFYSVGTSEKLAGFQAVQNPLITNNMRRQLPLELLNEIYKNLSIPYQCRILTVNFSTNALLGGPKVVMKKWLKWKQEFVKSISNCQEEIARFWPLMAYRGFAGAFLKRKIQIEWHSYKDCLDEAIVWFYQQREKPSFPTRITKLNCCRERKNQLDTFKKALAEEKALLKFLEKICSSQFECSEKMERQLSHIRRGLPEFIRPRKAHFNLVKAEVGNKLELADELFENLELAELKREWSCWEKMARMRRIIDE